MAELRHLYFFMENLGLTAEQRATLVTWLQELNTSRSPYPNLNMQVRIRLDNQAAIFESTVNRAWLEVDRIKEKLGEIFAVDPATITVRVIVNDYGEVVDFERPANTKRLRFGVFAGRDETWQHSREHAAEYLADNAAAWEEGA